jgi:hypothetical protein
MQHSGTATKEMHLDNISITLLFGRKFFEIIIKVPLHLEGLTMNLWPHQKM